MFDPYIIVTDSLRNTDHEGAEAFAFDARCGYYRRLILSMVEDLQVTVDGEPQPRENIRLTVAGETFTMDALAREFRLAWEFGEPATVTVLGRRLSPGTHELGLSETLRISYLPTPHVPATVQHLEVAA
ncbi:DUF6379 domain-containing protein [Microbacterium enclense]|uniref:C-glycoside deglycosidase beta subunit domain-containing protein n=1 Tax=Microbacterium enclense TaxID=993073 RepID=UPI0021A60BC9|nr:DUF6379 domain-containing protein [Microbacterium enclense]MCT2086883.1 DUF6379 domain-containing protein [Microbacterium enclense]